MLSSGHFPSQLKISRVIPLFKSGDPELFSNYRPISLLPSLSKIFERVIFNQLFNYMNNNKLLCLEQYGFRPGHSIELAALQLVNKITEQMDIGKIPLSIHMDYHLLDYIITRKYCEYISNFAVSHFISDHRALHASVRCLHLHPVRKRLMVRALQRIDGERLDSDLASFTVDNECVDVNTVVERYDEFLSSLLNKHAPLP